LRVLAASAIRPTPVRKRPAPIDAVGHGPKRKAAWDKMMTALAKHEDNHRLILLEEAAKFCAKVSAKTDVTRKVLQPMLDQFSKDIETAQALYDGKTGHGEKEGVFLPAPDKVKD
jgi:predicted secreted Zn-dependent protease